MATIIRAIFLIQFLSMYLETSHGFSSGPPTYLPGVCRTMIPSGHGPSVVTDADSPPFALTVDSTSYRPGEPLQVTLSSPQVSFIGFFLQARRLNPDDGSVVTQAIGRFSQFPSGTSGLMCNFGANRAWGHSNSNPKTSVTATWTPPANEDANVVFQATIVQGPTNAYFYTEFLSDELSLAVPTTPEPTTTTQEVPTTVRDAPTTRPTTEVPTTIQLTTAQEVPTTTEPTTPPEVPTTKTTTAREVPTTNPTTVREIPTTKPKTTRKIPTTNPTTARDVPTTKTTTTREVPTTRPKTTRKMSTTNPTTAREVPTTRPKTTRKISTVNPTTAREVPTTRATTAQEVPTTRATTAREVPTTFPTTTKSRREPTTIPATSRVVYDTRSPSTPGATTRPSTPRRDVTNTTEPTTSSPTTEGGSMTTSQGPEAESCSGDRCDQVGYDARYTCQCDAQCRRNRNCCEDYADHCLTEICTYVHSTYGKERRDRGR